MEMIENRTFDEITSGASACLMHTLSKEDLGRFAIVSGEMNPAHVDEDNASRYFGIRTDLRANGPVQTVFEQLGRTGMLVAGAP
jgi:acyl dehydratase